MATRYKALTVGEWARLPVGTVMERDNGFLYVVSKDGGRHLSDPWVVMGDPKEPHDEVTMQGPIGKFRFIGDSPEDTIRALGSLARIERHEGRQSAIVSAPGGLERILVHGTETPAGEKVLVEAILKRAKVYGKADAEYMGEAMIAPGFAVVYLRWSGDRPVTPYFGSRR
jgi:hypothetical protein